MFLTALRIIDLDEEMLSILLKDNENDVNTMVVRTTQLEDKLSGKNLIVPTSPINTMYHIAVAVSHVIISSKSDAYLAFKLDYDDITYKMVYNAYEGYKVTTGGSLENDIAELYEVDEFEMLDMDTLLKMYNKIYQNVKTILEFLSS